VRKSCARRVEVRFCECRRFGLGMVLIPFCGCMALVSIQHLAVSIQPSDFCVATVPVAALDWLNVDC
jgi:hypothetical protein